MSYGGDIEPTMVGGTRSTAQLVVTQGPWSGRQFSLDQASLIIGRAPECDIVLDDKEVSRRHTRLFWRSSQLMIEDLGSANGTLINGRPISGAHPIGPSDQIEIGASILQAQGVFPPAAVPARQEIVIPPPAPQMQAAPVATASQSNSSVWVAVGGVIVVIILALILVAAALWYFSSNQPGNLPEAAFIVPSNGAELMADVPIAVQASATDDAGVMRAELWIDGVLIGQQPSTSAQGDPILLLNLPWTPTTPGSHVLEIRAFDVDGQQNQTTLVTVNVAAAVAQVTDVPATEASATPTLLPTPTATLVDSSTDSGSGEQLPAATPTVTPEPSATPVAAPSLRTVSGVNVRGGPGTAYPVLGGLNTGQEIRPLGRSADGAWWQIVYPPNSGGVGWVSGPYVEPNEQALSLPVVAAPPPPATNTPTPTNTAVATDIPTPTPTATTSAPPDINFTADDTTLNVGECTYLRWRVRNIKAYWVDGAPGIGDEGSKKVCDPPGTTTHILKVQKNDDSFKEYGVEIIVGGNTTMPAPKLISPNNNKQFDYYPREVTFVWEPVNNYGSVTYNIQIQYDSGSWNDYNIENGLSGTTYTMDNFIGANPGRWRVQATNGTYGDGEKSDWRYFEFLQ